MIARELFECVSERACECHTKAHNSQMQYGKDETNSEQSEKEEKRREKAHTEPKECFWCVDRISCCLQLHLRACIYKNTAQSYNTTFLLFEKLCRVKNDLLISVDFIQSS